MMKQKVVATLVILVFGFLSLSAQNRQWLWANDGGSTSSDDNGYGIARDNYGNIFVTGTFRSPGVFGSNTLTGLPFCGEEVLVGELNRYGSWAWAVRGGGLSWDHGYAVTVDDSHNLHVVGKYNGSEYPHASFGPHTLTGSGSFLAKLNANGGWTSAIHLDGYAYDVAVDSQGNRYVVGYFPGTATFGSTTLTSEGDFDIYIAKLAPNGIWQWAKRAGGTAAYGYDDKGYGIDLDSEGNAYITGYFCGTANFGDTQFVAQNYDIFIAKLDSEGNWLWAKKAGGSNGDKGFDIKVDSVGSCYVTGSFMGGWFGSQYLEGWDDVFVTKLDSSGNFVWAKRAGGGNSALANGIALDAEDNCYITGYFDGNATFGTTVLSSLNGSNDVFVAKLDTDGNWLWAIRGGGVNYDIAEDIEVSPSGTCYITGRYQGYTSFGSHNLSSLGAPAMDWEVFIASLGVAPPLEPTNLLIEKSGNDVALQWDAVTENTLGQDIIPTHYKVYYASSPDPDASPTLVESVTGTSYIHSGGALDAETRFYFVKAFLQD